MSSASSSSISHPSNPISVFISYVNHDPRFPGLNDLVLSLAGYLRQNGFHSVIDQDTAAKPPDNWPLWMAQQVRRSTFTLFIPTLTYTKRVMNQPDPEYPPGLGVRWEGHVIYGEIYKPENRGRFIPVLFNQMTPEDIPAGWPSHYYTVKTNQASSLTPLLDRLVGHNPIQMPAISSTVYTPKPARRPESLFADEKKRECLSRCNLNDRVSHFKAQRLTELKQLILKLQPGSSGCVMCAITGVAGCGKSELAKAYAGESNSEFKWRLDRDPGTTSNKAFKVAYFKLLQNFCLQYIQVGESEPPEGFHRYQNHVLWQRIAQFESWIVIFDNVESEADIRDYLPPKDVIIKGQSLILITTQNHNFLDTEAANFSTANAGLDPKEAIQLLAETSHVDTKDDPNAMKLVKDLDYSPLSIRVAGSYIHRMQKYRITFDDYSELLKSSAYRELVDRLGGSELIQKATQDEGRSATLQAILELLIQKLEKTNPQLLQVLQYCSLLANEGIPSELLVELCKEPSDERIVAQQRLAVLTEGKENYSLLSYDSTTESHNLHRTTQFVVRKLIRPSHGTLKRITRAILKLYSYDDHWTQSIINCKKIELHLSQLVDHLGSVFTSTEVLVRERSKLLFILGKTSYEYGYLSNASKYLRDALKISMRAVISELQYDIARYLGNITYISREFGISEEYFESATKLGKMIYRPTDWQMAHIFNDRGDSLEVKSEFIMDTAACELATALQNLEQNNGIPVEKSYRTLDRMFKLCIKESNPITEAYAQRLLDSFGEEITLAGLQLIENLQNFHVTVESSMDQFQIAERICTEYLEDCRHKGISCTDCKLQLFRSYIGRARCLQRTGNDIGALGYYGQASEICTPIFKKLVPHMAEIYNDPKMLQIFRSGSCSIEDVIVHISALRCPNPVYDLTSIRLMHPTRGIFRVTDI